MSVIAAKMLPGQHLLPVLGLVVALLLVGAGPATAAVSDAPGAPRWQAPRATTPPVQLQPCVTTTWRAAYWDLPKTRVGEVCWKVDRSTWIPKSWPRAGTVVVDGQRRPVFLRTA